MFAGAFAAIFFLVFRLGGEDSREREEEKRENSEKRDTRQEECKRLERDRKQDEGLTEEMVHYYKKGRGQDRVCRDKMRMRYT